ncbi:hypothetical protein MRX96_048450 [Rhipicephalus microplus]
MSEGARVELKVVTTFHCEGASSGVMSHLTRRPEETSVEKKRGDSGGPVTTWRHGLGYQVGVVSFGLGCARPHGTTLHTNLQFYLPWIASEIASRKRVQIIDY